ncbi:MAG: pyridoxamine 5'-phosphate oxidase [Candidatus Pseudobacter hemicellulosilyticus]|uniref:Pyridoxine/pyridoxamine 5'-phosphate oxidase n=1 Tax=Candidatus Pseudobacter hemicellulosilyticus TaxID=3121375 RepID=A0AAJ5WS26_9BACT|nr:MAG: pyridoxamine 5'-phosphate oxidase [Pseudobacter sp.]
MKKSVADIRTDYQKRSLSEKDVQPTPMQQFDSWWKEAVESELEEVNAMTLATASADGVPSARIMLLKDYDEKGFVFFTNYNSFKGLTLEENPRAALVFFWKELERQVRVTGLVEKVAAAESDEYFNSRPEGSRIGAWVSPQSQVIENRDYLIEREKSVKEAFSSKPVTRPPHWGGFRVKPVIIEFWQGGASRLHDRIQYTLQEDNSWLIERLAP